MAQQKGIFKVKGTIGDTTFYKSQDGYLIKEKSAIEASRIANAPSFQRTRENNSEFGRAGKACKLFRDAVRTQLQNVKDGRLVSRLTTEMMKVIKSDATSTRGQRNIIDGETEMLVGFDFNIKAKLGATMFAPFTANINRVTGELGVNIPAFLPANAIAAPAGTTHFKIVTAGAEIDFENGSHVTDAKETPALAWDTTPTALFDIVNIVTPNSTHPLFVLLGVQFYQAVNGVNYPLKNGGFNSLAIVKVSGV